MGVDRDPRAPLDLGKLLATPLSLTRLTLLEVGVPQVEPFQSAIGVRHERRALFVRWTDGDGAWGIGECSCRPDPYYSGEFVAGAICVVRDYIFPHLPPQGTLADVIAASEKVRGWPFTTAAVLDAAFDLLRRKGVHDGLDTWPTPPQRRTPVGISLGLFDTPDAAVQRVESAVAEGYHRVKLKVAPQMNLDTLVAVREAFPTLSLGFDANGSCGPDNAAFLEALAALKPTMLEQPFAPGRLDLCAALKAHRPDLWLCLDESIKGLGSLITAHRLHALDEVNLKPGRVGGPLETLRFLDYAARHRLPMWVGGMFETGVGRAANLRVAARLPDASAHDLSPSRRYFATDVVAHPLDMDAEGYIALGDERPVTLDEATLDHLCQYRLDLDKPL